MDPMVTKGSTPQDYSASASDTVSARDTVSLVVKEYMMGGPPPGGFTAGVGQMKLEAPQGT